MGIDWSQGEFGEPWKESKASDAIISSKPPTKGQYTFDDSADFYGGDLVAESCRPDNRRRIIACINACVGMSTESLESIGQDVNTPDGPAVRAMVMMSLLKQSVPR